MQPVQLTSPQCPRVLYGGRKDLEEGTRPGRGGVGVVEVDRVGVGGVGNSKLVEVRGLHMGEVRGSHMGEDRSSHMGEVRGSHMGAGMCSNWGKLARF